VFRTSLLKEVGGFRKGFQGSQDYDLILRFTEKTNRIFHIPEVLYHWRVLPNSQLSATSSLPYESAIKALKNALVRRGINGEVIQTHRFGSYKVERKVKGNPLVSIIITTRDNKEILEQCIKSILNKTSYKNYEIIIVDNNSCKPETLGYFDYLLGKYPDRIRVLPYPKPFNFSDMNNYAIKRSNGKYIILLNNDIEVITPKWIDELLAHSQRSEVGVVGAKLLYPDGRIQHAGVLIGAGGVADHLFRNWKDEEEGYFFRKDVIEDLSCVTAACMMVRKEVFKEVGGLDSSNLAIAFNDVDFCLKVKEHGYLIVYNPFARLYHHEGFSRGKDTYMNTRFLKENKFMKDKWGVKLKRDPFWPTPVSHGDIA
jgi:GT2 family glycosyltransferase